MPWNTVQGKSLHITDSAKYSKNKLSISGDMEQEKRSGKNKFKVPESSTSNGVTLTKNTDGSFTLNGTTTGVAIFSATLNNPLKTGTYTISYKSSVALKLEDSFFLRVRDKDNTLVNPANPASQVVGNNSTYNAATYTSNVESAIVAINLTKAGVTYNNVVIYPQLEEGNVATDFEKYGATPSMEFPSIPKVATGVQKIRQFGKNFAPLSTNRTINGITLSVSQGIYTLNGTATNTCFFNIPLKNVLPFGTSKTMSLQILDGTASGNGEFYLAFRARNSSNVYSGVPDIAELQYKSDSNKYTTKTITNECASVEITVLSGVTLNNVKLTIQLEEGTIATPYESYWEKVHTLNLGSTELCAIKDNNGNVISKDRAVFRNGKWQWEKKIGKRVLNGTEEWQAVESSSATTSSSKGVFYLLGRENIQITSHFKNNNLDSITNNLTAFNNLEDNSFNVRRNTQDRVYFRKSDITELNEFKTWLSTHNLTVYYILENPQYIDCTTEQSVVLDKLYNNFELGKGTNNIIVESENGVGVDMDLTYMQDLQAKLNSLEAMCVSNASQEV